MTEIVLPYISSNKVLLTGAGFTHNFGGLLAKDMWAEIFNNSRLQENIPLRKLMLDQFDFESVYFDVMNNKGWEESDKKVLADAVYSAYERMDEVVRNWVFNKDAPYPVNEYGLRKLIGRFGEAQQPGFFFTLNQDLFIERKFVGEDKPKIPGVPNHHKWFSAQFNQPLVTNDLCQLPTAENLEKKKDLLFEGRCFYYIKLHGSHNWIGSDGNRRMVIGRDKKNQINREPLLREYLSVFRQVLSQKNCYLLVIGYGFGDEHINSVITDAINEHGLKVYVMSPSSISDFSDAMSVGNQRTIFNALAGYYPYDLLTLFPTDQSNTPYIKNIYENFFC